MRHRKLINDDIFLDALWGVWLAYINMNFDASISFSSKADIHQINLDLPEILPTLAFTEIIESDNYKNLSLKDKLSKATRTIGKDRPTALCLMKDLAINYNYEEAQISLGLHYLCYDSGWHFKNAIPWLLMAGQKNNSAYAYCEIGKMYFSIGYFEDARKYLEMALEMGYGEAYTLLKQVEKEEKELEIIY